MDANWKLLGKRIRAARKRVELSQWQLAEKTGLSNNHYSNLERTVRLPSLKTLAKICIATSTPAEDLMAGVIPIQAPIKTELQIDDMNDEEMQRYVVAFVAIVSGESRKFIDEALELISILKKATRS